VSASIPLPEALEREMARQEANRKHIPAAREVLERAVIHQFQVITDGLIADRILSNQPINDRFWAAQYLTRHPKDTADKWRAAKKESTRPTAQEPEAKREVSALQKIAEFMRAEHPPDIQTYEKSFHLKIARREVTRINPKDLFGASVRIYGGRVPVWQEGRINAQLSRLGSDLRLIVVSADVCRSADLLAKIGFPGAANPAPLAFVLGETSPCSSHFKAALFEFNHEWAVSPYLDTASPGFVDQCRICWRNRMFSGIVLNLELGSPIAMGQSQTLFGHEVGHITQRYGFVLPGHFASWRAVMRDDICRFAQTPKRGGDIHIAFYKTFEQFELNPVLSQGLLPPGEPKTKLELINVLQELVDDRLLEVMRDGKVRCNLYDDGREWQVV
jgi:hypothetical protein